MKEKDKKLIIHLIRDFGHVPWLFLTMIICIIVPPAMLAFYLRDAFVFSFEMISLMACSSAFTILVFVLIVIFTDWFFISQKIADKEPRKNMIEKFLEEKKNE